MNLTATQTQTTTSNRRRDKRNNTISCKTTTTRQIDKSPGGRQRNLTNNNIMINFTQQENLLVISKRDIVITGEMEEETCFEEVKTRRRRRPSPSPSPRQPIGHKSLRRLLMAPATVCLIWQVLATFASVLAVQTSDDLQGNQTTSSSSSASLITTPPTVAAAMMMMTTTTTNNSDNIVNKLTAKAEALVSGGPVSVAAAAATTTTTTNTNNNNNNNNINNNNQININNAKLFEACKLQSRVGLQLTNLSQIMFQPVDVCSSWQKMMRSSSSSNDDLINNNYPWFYIEQLNLSHNNLTVLHDSSGMSRLINLLELRITHNQLTRCEESSLAGLRQLQTLDLSHNKLMALPAKFFQPVKQTIKKLNLSFNSISVLVPTLFDSLQALEYLDLSHNDITSHWINDRLFKNLTQLHYLDLSFNKLTVFSSPMTFSSLQQLETLSLQHNELRQVPETIQYLRYLSSLDLSQNFIHDITNASYLSNCRLLFNLNLEANLLENITRDAFSDLPALKVLNLANNRIYHLDQQAFEYVPDLHALRLDSNNLIDFGQAFVNLRFLLMLNISSNRITSFDYAQIPLGLQWLDLHSNKIDKLNNFYYSPTAQQQFSSAATANDINQQASASSIGQQWQSMLRLTTLDASFNLIKELDNTSLPESLETVQLNNNHLRTIASHTFSTKSNLTRINLSHNQLTTMPYDSLKLHGNRDSTQQQLQAMMIGGGGGGGSGASGGGQKFVDIYLANNPYVCNCNMGWLSQLLLASSTLMQGNNFSYGNSNNNQLLREHQLILSRQMPRVADAHSVNCHLPFARQSPFYATQDPHRWSPVMAANQLALGATGHHQHLAAAAAAISSNTISNNRDSSTAASSLIVRQSELLASVHLCPYKSHCFALCFCCDFDACDCEMSCPENCSCYYDQTWSTNIVDCSANNQINGNPPAQAHSGTSNNRLPLQQQHHHYRPSSSNQPQQPVKFVNIPDKIPMDVTELYLDGLELLHLRGNSLIGRRNLKTLYLNNSQVYSIEPKAFATQKALRILQLNSNHLSELHGHEFEQQVELRELYLAHNQLSSIANMTFSSLKSLQILHLQNNHLYHLNFWSNIPTGHKLISVNLGSNPWSCQCDHVEPMLQWLNLNVKHLHDRKSVTCQFNRTNSLHLLAPLLTSPPPSASSQELQVGEQDLSAVYGSMSENYPMFDVSMCLNYTVYPVVPTQPMLPNSAVMSSGDIQRAASGELGSQFRQRDYPSHVVNPTTEEILLAANNNSFTLPNDEPFNGNGGARPFNSAGFQAGGSGFGGGYPQPMFDHNGLPQQQQQAQPPPASDSISSPGQQHAGFQFPPPSSKSNIFSSTFLLGVTSMTLILVVVILSLIHYRRPMSVWFYSRYGLNMFSATKSHNHAMGGSMGKSSHLHHHHHHQHHPHLHGHHCGASSTGSTSSSSAASSNLSQALCQQQQSTTVAAASSGLVTTPLIVTNHHHHHHQLLNSAAATATTTTSTATSSSSPYNDDEKLFDAYVTYSKQDEQFINEFIAPELEYGQPAYRVALHYRDVPATAAKFLSDCIIETANASRRIIMVLSEQMLKTEWTQFEFRTAHLEALRNNYRHRLIVVMLGQPSLASLDADIVQWLKSCACIQWGDKMFWQRLRFSMPELPYSRQQQQLQHQQQAQYLRYQTLAPHQQQHQASTGNTGSQQAKHQLRHNFGANLLKSAGLFGGSGGGGHQHNHHHQLPPSSQQQLVTSNSMHQSLGRPLPPIGSQSSNLIIRPSDGADHHHYAHLTPSTMIQNQQQQQQQQHTYHQPIYGDPQQQQQQQQSIGCAGPTVPVHI